MSLSPIGLSASTAATAALPAQAATPAPHSQPSASLKPDTVNLSTAGHAAAAHDADGDSDGH